MTLEFKYYVETSVWGMIPKGQPRVMRRASLQFFSRVPKTRLFISRVVLDEVEDSPESVRGPILRAIDSIKPSVLEVTIQASSLSRAYISSKVLPAKKKEDALHVAIATTEELDLLVSWNYRHMANQRKTELYSGVNLAQGYWKTPRITTPLGALDG